MRDKSVPPTDLDGRGRPLDGNGDGQAVCDVGAYEYIALAQPDLVVRDGWLRPECGPPGRIVQIGLRVENRGNATAQGNWTHVYLSRDATYNPGDVLWIQGIRVPALSPGQGHVYSSSAAIPSLPFATYHVLVYCDVDNALAESNEQNNWSRIGGLILATRADSWLLYR